MIDSIIIARALQNVSRLTLPGFGTVLKKPDGSFVFSQFLRDDDMYFTSVVMNTYAVGTDEAKAMVSEFLAEITSRLATRGEYVIPEVGRLVREQSGAVRLTPDFNINPEPVYQDPQPRQTVVPRPIVGVPQQSTVPPAQNPYQSQMRQQVPYGVGRQPVIPQRRPQQQSSQQRPPMRPQQQAASQQPQRAHSQHHKHPRQIKPAKKDWLLIATVFVALLVLLLMIYSFFTASLSDMI